METGSSIQHSHGLRREIVVRKRMKLNRKMSLPFIIEE